ncbi:hypothetical protein [Phascolarctobacterium sp.]|uniref:hypothetical protein n=1 Tax=Phascolarctobacterium sp. TaxID=2049039 RepID=UPI003862D839
MAFYRKSKNYNTNVKKINIDILKNTRYKKVYSALVQAKKLYAVDKSACCLKLRYALEMIIAQLLEITNKDSAPNNSTLENIKILEQAIPPILRTAPGCDIIGEMHTLRINGNNSVHYGSNRNRNIDKSTHTCWIAMEKICYWIVDFEAKYRDYMEQKELAEQKARRTRAAINQVNNTWYHIGKGLLALPKMIVSAIFGSKKK